ncbi:MAG: hypothetical protein QOI86_2777 [Actinomycetota bacterium]|jgi:hypothetical protein|nr:hypothetical protein [Actinomycetota bacterium]
MSTASGACFIASLVYFAVWFMGYLARRTDVVRAALQPLSPEDYAAAKKRVGEISRWSPESKDLRNRIYETDHPGFRQRARRMILLLAVGSLAAGVILALLS